MAKIFISHSSKDKVFVRELAEDLTQLGHKAWLDEWEIRVGDCIVTKVEQGIQQCDYVVIVLTPDAVESGWVDREWKAAYWTEIEDKKIIVLPVLLKDCPVPPLLKTRKYADFRKRYSVGFAQLTQAFVPIEFEQHKSFVADDRKDDRDISNLLAKVQGKQVPLSQCIAEGLAIGRKYKNKELIEFCTEELAGWDSNSPPQDEKHSYRQIEAFFSYSAKINPQYFGWGENASNMFSYMENDTKHFFPVRVFVSHPIARLEEDTPGDLTKAYISWTTPISAMVPDAKDSQGKIYCYARGTAYKNVAEAIRAEFTKKLLKLLPQIR